MATKNVVRVALVLLILGVGSLLLFQGSDLTPESPQRQQAVQRALRPGSQSAAGSGAVLSDAMAESDVGAPIFGQSSAPVSVDIMDLPEGREEGMSMQEAWEAGLIDMGRIDSLFSEAVIDTLQAESAAQPVDPSVQIINAPDPETAKNLSQPELVAFKSIDFNQTTGSVPPDPIIAAGHKGVIAAVNTSFQAYDKQGNALFPVTTFASFWGSICGSGTGVTFFDPFLEYDEDARRFIIGITAFDSTINNGDNGWACIAVSKTDNPDGEYWLYSFDGNPGAGTDLFFDYPHLGVGQKALYIEANMFAGDTFQKSRVMAFEKIPMYLGNATQFTSIDVPGHFTIQPSKIHGKTTGGWPTNANEPHYYVSAATGNNRNTLTVWQFKDPFPFQTASFTQAGTVTVNTYNMPIDQAQAGSAAKIQANDNRMLDVKYWNGRLYATHTIGCNPGGGTVNCVAWYVIDMSSGSPVLLDQGRIGSATDDFGRIFPAIAVNMCGDILVGYTAASADVGWNPSIFVMGRQFGDPPGQMKGETLVMQGDASYTAFDTPPHRWGDYTGMAIDPNGKSFWYLGEHSRNQPNSRWSTWIVESEWPQCTQQPTPTPTPTNTPMATNTPTPTNTPINTPTATSTNFATPTNTPTPPSNQMCSIYSSSDVPKSIPDNSVATVSSLLNVPDPGLITDLNVVNLKGEHTWVQDLNFNLKSPQGTEVQILDLSTCGDDLKDFDINLDDEASANPPCPPVGGGTYYATNLLSAFDGQEQSGMWTLRIEDTFAEDGGKLESWGLYICKDITQATATPTPTTPPDATATPTATSTSTPDPEATSTPTSEPRSSSTPTATPESGDDFKEYLPFINRP